MPFAIPAHLSTIHPDCPHLFEHLISPSGPRFRANEPRVDVLQSSGKVTFILNVPGVPFSGVNILVKDGLLTVSGAWATPYDWANEAEVVELEERAKGKFQRVFYVPKGLGAKDIKATLADGLLRIEYESPKGVGKGEGEMVVVSLGAGGYC